jgi:uncharacterized protein (TIGR00290 family)
MLALYHGLGQEYSVTHLLNMQSSPGRYSRSHGIPKALMQQQARCLGIELVQSSTTWKMYEDRFKAKLRKLRKKGVGYGIFGDIDLDAHREWVERVCADVGMEAVLPLWQKDRMQLLDTFIDAGFEGFVTTIRTDLVDRSFLGRKLNHDFVEQMKQLTDIDICGENGEYHTFVYNGPLFKQPVRFRQIGERFFKNYGQALLESIGT